jgi:hypothetical protein
VAGVPTSAARIPNRLLDAIERIDDGKLPLAEIARRVGAEADRLGLTRPSYERVRQLIHELRELRPRDRGPSALQIFLDDGAAGGPMRRTIDQILLPRDERRPRR